MHQCVPCVPKIWNWTSKIMPDLWLSAIFCQIKKITPSYCTFFPQKVTLKIEFKTKELRKGLSNVKIQIFAGLGISSLVFSESLIFWAWKSNLLFCRAVGANCSCHCLKKGDKSERAKERIPNPRYSIQHIWTESI